MRQVIINFPNGMQLRVEDGTALSGEENCRLVLTSGVCRGSDGSVVFADTERIIEQRIPTEGPVEFFFGDISLLQIREVFPLAPL